MTPSVLLGELAALAAAFSWAVAVLLFRRPIAEHGARAVNLAKNAVATLLLGLTVVAAGQVTTLFDVTPTALVLIAASGLIGLTVGDTALFAAVGRLGAHRSLLLQTLTPIFAAVLAFALEGERPTPVQLLGAGIVLAGVLVAIAPRRRVAPRAPFDAAGTFYGVLGAFGQGAGIVLAKSAMATLPILGASFLRMAVGSLGLVLLLALAGRLGATTRALLRRASLVRIVPPSLLGTYLAFLLMMAAIAWAPAAIAAVLIGTTPIFSLFLEARADRRPLAPAAVAGTLVAVVGVAVLALAA